MQIWDNHTSPLEFLFSPWQKGHVFFLLGCLMGLDNSWRLFLKSFFNDICLHTSRKWKRYKSSMLLPVSSSVVPEFWFQNQFVWQNDPKITIKSNPCVEWWSSVTNPTTSHRGKGNHFQNAAQRQRQGQPQRVPSKSGIRTPTLHPEVMGGSPCQTMIQSPTIPTVWESGRT